MSIVINIFATIGLLVVTACTTAWLNALYNHRLSYKKRYEWEKYKNENLKIRLSQQSAVKPKAKKSVRKNALPQENKTNEE